MPIKTVDHVPISETCSGNGLRTTQHNLNRSTIEIRLEEEYGGKGGGISLSKPDFASIITQIIVKADARGNAEANSVTYPKAIT